jgi:hypothetical protein
MTPDVLRAFFRIGVFVTGISVLLAIANPTDSPEFVVSVCSVMIGATLMLIVGIVTWFSSR